jgi:hypothetical protein
VLSELLAAPLSKQIWIPSLLADIWNRDFLNTECRREREDCYTLFSLSLSLSRNFVGRDMPPALWCLCQSIA